MPRALATEAPPQQEGLRFPGGVLGVQVRQVGIEALRAPVQREVQEVQEALRDVVGKRHPMMLAAAEQIFGAGGKRVRPLICLLVAMVGSYAPTKTMMMQEVRFAHKPPQQLWQQRPQQLTQPTWRNCRQPSSRIWSMSWI